MRIKNDGRPVCAPSPWTVRNASMSGSAVLGASIQSVHEQSDPSHESDATRDRGDCANDGFYSIKINVPDEFSVHAVNSDVKDDAPGFHHVSRNELGFADGCHQDVSTAAYLGEVGRAAVRQCDGRV